MQAASLHGHICHPILLDEQLKRVGAGTLPLPGVKEDILALDFRFPLVFTCILRTKSKKSTPSILLALEEFYRIGVNCASRCFLEFEGDVAVTLQV